MKALLLLFALSLSALAVEPSPGWRFEELRRFPAPEARQGVAVDRDGFIAIGNFELGRYGKEDGRRVAAWSCPEGKPLTHLNAGVVVDGRLYCAHSNYPGVPNLSSVEIWDASTLKHAGSHSFGRADGSFTWLDRRKGRWLACFVHYGKKGGEPGRGPEWTRLVEYDDDWRETGAWAFPADLVAHVGARGYSFSGGALGPGGYLYVTGHDEPELYVLAFPEAGPSLEWVATLQIPTAGQAFAWDPAQKDRLYLIGRKDREVIEGRLVSPK